jgi:hypothetical protein
VYLTRKIALVNLENSNATDHAQFDACVGNEDLVEAYFALFKISIRDATTNNVVNSLSSYANRFLFHNNCLVKTEFCFFFYEIFNVIISNDFLKFVMFNIHMLLSLLVVLECRNDAESK